MWNHMAGRVATSIFFEQEWYFGVLWTDGADTERAFVGPEFRAIGPRAEVGQRKPAATLLVSLH
jgi:hypothetical protein